MTKDRNTQQTLQVPSLAERLMCGAAAEFMLTSWAAASQAAEIEAEPEQGLC